MYFPKTRDDEWAHFPKFMIVKTLFFAEKNPTIKSLFLGFTEKQK